MWISFPGFLSLRQRFVMLLKFVIENEPKDFTHLFELKLGLRQLVYLPEAIYVKTVIELKTTRSIKKTNSKNHLKIYVSDFKIYCFGFLCAVF